MTALPTVAERTMAELRRTQLVGLLLWRGGLLFVACYSSYRGMRQLVRWVELPLQLEVGVALALAGLVLVVVSLILERVQDARTEGDLSS